MSAVPFDPYYKWLGIPPHKQPANHYRLLGIDQFENDLQVIEAAADRQMAFLRKYQAGENAAEALRLLNEVSRARICLLKPDSKADYDAELRGELDPNADQTPVPLHLVVTHEDGSTVNWPLAADQTCLIGRGTTATLRVDDPYTSRAHCQIETRGPRWVISDLDSSMGTYVNRARVRRANLKPGDQIAIGRTRIKVTAGVVPSQTATQPLFSDGPTLSQMRVDDFLGKTIHHYCIERVLAEGSRSTVFLARHVERQRDIAVKIVKPTPGQDDRWRRQFVTDVKSFLEFKHPNIVRLHSTGRFGPYCWLAMEHVPGENLKQVIDGIKTTGVPDWKTAHQVTLHIARALGVAESHQIAHRNLTPKSILLRTSDKVAKLADLMLAETWSVTPSNIAPTGELVGDLAYMPPERVLKTSNSDHRSDIYGLGAAVYGLLTGRPPFEADSPQQLRDRMANEQPPPPTKFNPTIPAPFEAVVLRMLAKRPEDRFQSAQDLIKQLEQVGGDSAAN